MTFDFVLKLAPIVLAVPTIVVGMLVYRLSAQKLFHDMRAGRLEALAKFRASALARLSALEVSSDLRVGSQEEHEQLSALWSTGDDARLWFGDVVKSSIGEVTDSLRRLAVTRAALIDAVDRVERRAHGEKYTAAFLQVIDSLDALTQEAQPYLDIGTRGLSSFERMVHAFRSKRMPKRARLQQRWSQRVDQMSRAVE